VKRILAVLILVFSGTASSQTTAFPFNETEKKIQHAAVSDTSSLNIQAGPVYRDKHNTGNLIGQALVGPALSFGFSIFPSVGCLGTLFSDNSNNDGFTILAGTAVAAYILGAATGVHWVARAQNPKISYWKTAGYSLMGGVAGAGVLWAFSAKYKTIPWTGVTLALASPTIASMIYASYVADWPEKTGIGAGQSSGLSSRNYSSLSHKDLIESSMLFNIRIMHIEF